MNIFDVAPKVYETIEGSTTVFLKTEPEVLDFTTPSAAKLVIISNKARLELEINPSNIAQMCGVLDATVFNKDVVRKLYVWNLKSLATYVLRFLGKNLQVSNFIDLKTIEGFLNIRQRAPETYPEVIDRANTVTSQKTWLNVYKAIHVPLILKVLPAIETQGLLHTAFRTPVFPYYDIEGQANGRLNCSKKFSKSFLPHSMGIDVKEQLKPRGYGQCFATSDFLHCEVTVLQWLSKDELLGSILASGDDLHEKIYEIVTGDKCNTEHKRNLSKLMFLPVIYGCGPTGLAKNLGISENHAKELHNRIKAKFSTAIAYLDSFQEKAKAGELVFDYFGRPRRFSEAYLVRNFLVQAVAATVCQEKLIDLYNELKPTDSKIIFSIHDGYGMVSPLTAAKDLYLKIKKILDSESKLCPGLKMKTKVEFGHKLTAMKVLRSK